MMESPTREKTKGKKKRKKNRKRNFLEQADTDVATPTQTHATHASKGSGAETQNETASVGKKRPRVSEGVFPFEVDETDHCETPVEAYKDVVVLLDLMAKSLKKTRKNLQIYDPYYCDGGIKMKLQSLGFHSVFNERQDFYKVIESNEIPSYDVLITNPPYSGVHVEKLLSFCRSTRKPFLLLLPHYVYTKDYFERSLGQELMSKLFYLVPNRRYSYLPPDWVDREKGSTVLQRNKTQTAPFPSFWYCRVPVIGHGWLVKTFGPSGKYRREAKIHYAKCAKDIPRDCKGEFDQSKKRPNPRARKRAKQQKRPGAKM